MNTIPDTTVCRLPVYLRCLLEAQAEGIAVVSSLDIAGMSGTNAAQVRKDLSYLGELGTRGIGYEVQALQAHISGVLGLTRRRRVAIVGYGRLGGALLNYIGSGDHGFDVVAVVDSDPVKIGTSVGSLAVRPATDLEDVLNEARVEIAVITAPAAAARKLATRVVGAGVRAVLNFAPIALEVPDGVTVRNVDLSTELQVLSFHLACTGSV